MLIDLLPRLFSYIYTNQNDVIHKTTLLSYENELLRIFCESVCFKMITLGFLLHD